MVALGDSGPREVGPGVVVVPGGASVCGPALEGEPKKASLGSHYHAQGLKTQSQGGCLAQCLRRCVGHTHPLAPCLGSIPSTSTWLWLPTNAHHGRQSDGPRTRGPATHVGHLDGAALPASVKPSPSCGHLGSEAGEGRALSLPFKN